MNLLLNLTILKFANITQRCVKFFGLFFFFLAKGGGEVRNWGWEQYLLFLIHCKKIHYYKNLTIKTEYFVVLVNKNEHRNEKGEVIKVLPCIINLGDEVSVSVLSFLIQNNFTHYFNIVKCMNTCDFKYLTVYITKTFILKVEC